MPSSWTKLNYLMNSLELSSQGSVLFKKKNPMRLFCNISMFAFGQGVQTLFLHPFFFFLSAAISHLLSLADGDDCNKNK